MGYPLHLFLNQQQIDQEFICNICHKVMEDPMMSHTCQHIFCSVCINNWLSSSKTCPINREPIARVLATPIPAYMNMYHRLKLKCSFVGCSAIITIGELESHVDSCPFNPAAAVQPCVHDCGAGLALIDIPSHNCIVYLKGELAMKEKAHELEKTEWVELTKELKKRIGEKNEKLKKMSINIRKRKGADDDLELSDDDDDSNIISEDDDDDFDSGLYRDPHNAGATTTATEAESIADILRRNTTIDYNNAGSQRGTKVMSLAIPRNTATKARETGLSPRIRLVTKAPRLVNRYCKRQ